MSQRIFEQLIFRPASEKPTAEMDDQDVLVYNPCDGWHAGTVHVREEDGEIYHIGIYKSLMDEMTPHSFYVAWALLPDGIELGKKFENERNPYWHPALDD